MLLNCDLESDMEGGREARLLPFMSHYTERDHVDPEGDFFFLSG